MLKVEHLHIQLDAQHVLIDDASFSLPNRGIVSICANHDITCTTLAQVLSGMQDVKEGSITYNDEAIEYFDEEQRSLYRSIFASSLYFDFQILKDKSVFQNVSMGLEYPMERVEQELRTWKLEDKRDVLAEDLSTIEQWRMVLVRIVLRQPMMLVFDVIRCPLSSQELIEFYALLEELRTQMLIVIIGDQSSYSISNRTIEFFNGHIISDSLIEEEHFPQINHTMEAFQLTRSITDGLYGKMYTHIRWKLRCASLLCVMAFICLSTAIFSTTLDITDIQMRLMEKQGSSMIAIEKMAENTEGSVMRNEYSLLDKEDIQTLNDKLASPIVLGYEPVDVREATYYTYGTSILDEVHNDMNDFTIVEANSNVDLGLKKMYGTYPKTYQEVALSSSQAYALLKDELEEPYKESEEQMKEMLHKEVDWYGNTFEITAIFPSTVPQNVNLDLDMTGYNGDTKQSSAISDRSFFVKIGFVENYHVLQSKVYKKTYKRMISNARVVTSFNHISSLDRDVYYYNGSEVVMDYDIQKDEVILDFPMALDMGYRSTYQYGVDELHQVSFDERVKAYEAFCDQWIGKTITLQTYTTQNSPNASAVMSQKVNIKGFIIPITYDYLERYISNLEEGCAYLNRDIVAKYSSQNHYIKEAFYHGRDTNDLRQALSYLNKQTLFAPYLTNSRILQFFVVDLKNMNTLFIILGTLSIFVYVMIFLFLLRSTIQLLRRELSTYYIFGERKSVLQKLMITYFHNVIWMRTLFGWFCGTLALGTFILMIYFTLSASQTILWSLCLPLLLLCITLVILRVACAITMRHLSVIEEEFGE